MAGNNSQKPTLLDKVNDGFKYFYGHRLEELETDDAYYIKAFMEYIDNLEDRISYAAEWL